MTGQLKLFDFGLAAVVKRRTFCEEVYEMSGNTGTLAYMAPEVALRKPYNEKVDIFSFGIILWQMLHGEAPFKGLSRKDLLALAMCNKRQLTVSIANNLAPLLARLVDVCTSANHNDRPTAPEIIAALNNLLQRTLV